KGTPGTLEWKNSLAVSSEEVTNATRVASLPTSENGSLLNYLSRKSVFDKLFKTGDLKFTAEPRNGNANRAHTIGRFEICGKGNRKRAGIVILGVGNELPGMAAIEALMRKADMKRAVVMSAITKKHFVALLVGRWNERLRERKRGVFEIT